MKLDFNETDIDSGYVKGRQEAYVKVQIWSIT